MPVLCRPSMRQSKNRRMELVRKLALQTRLDLHMRRPLGLKVNHTNVPTLSVIATTDMALWRET